MPRKAKEKEVELNNLIKESKQEVNSSKIAKKTSVTKRTAAKKSMVKEITNKKSTSQKATIKSDSKTKKRLSPSKSKVANSSVSSKKTTIKNATAKTKSTRKSSTKTEKTPIIIEYYDLPFRYNQTIVKILAQTPNILFIYWDISDDDRNAYNQKYGPDFFQNTRPYLIITNETMRYTFEVEINDFANSWYLHVNDADCQYKVELGRKFIVDSSHDSPSESHNLEDYFKPFVNYMANDYLSITSSNEIEMPNNRILFDRLGKSVFFRNVKTNIMNEKDISSLSFLQKVGKVYNIYDLYKEIYKDEFILDEFGLNLPSSNSSSSFM